MGNKIRLGDLLVRAGLITDSDLRVVLAQQKQHGGRLGEHLVRVNLCSEEQIARALAQQLGLVYNDLARQPSPAITSLIPEKVAARLQALAVGYDPRTQQLSVAFSDPLDEEAIEEIARITGKAIAPQVTPANPLRRAIEHAYFGVEVRDEGTKEFELVDIHGRATRVSAGGAYQPDEDAPLLSTGDMEPLNTGENAPLALQVEEGSGEHPPLSAQQPAAPKPAPLRVAPPAPRPAPKPAPAAAAAADGAGEEALRTVWALAELLIERGYFTRAELMKTLRGK